MDGPRQLEPDGTHLDRGCGNSFLGILDRSRLLCVQRDTRRYRAPHARIAGLIGTAEVFPVWVAVLPQRGAEPCPNRPVMGLSCCFETERRLPPSSIATLGPGPLRSGTSAPGRADVDLSSALTCALAVSVSLFALSPSFLHLLSFGSYILFIPFL